MAHAAIRLIRRVEIIQPDMYAVLEPVPYDFIHDALQLVIERNDMVAVPAYAAADMQQYLIDEL